MTPTIIIQFETSVGSRQLRFDTTNLNIAEVTPNESLSTAYIVSDGSGDMEMKEKDGQCG